MFTSLLQKGYRGDVWTYETELHFLFEDYGPRK